MQNFEVVTVEDLGALIGDCAHCGTAIRYRALVRLDSGAQEGWGTTCAGLTPSGRDYALERTKFNNWLSENPIISEALEAYESYCVKLEEVKALAPEGARVDGLDWALVKSAEAVLHYGENSYDNYIEELTNAYQAGDFASAPVISMTEFIGEVGKKLTVKVEVKKVMIFQAFHYGAKNPRFIIAEDSQGNCITTKTTSDWAYEVKKGDALELVGTVKEHTIYNNIKQTVLTRCKSITY